MKKVIVVIILSILFISNLNSQVVSDWRGIGRTGVYNETGLLEKWSEEGPKMLWSLEEIPKGYSSVAVVKGMVYFTGIKDSTDYLLAVDKTGKMKWETAIGGAWTNSFPNSRSTPVIEKGKIYVSSGKGDIACINAKTGKIIWSLKASQKFNGPYGVWGISESLLIVDDKVIFTPGGKETTMVAFNKKNGELIWKSESINDTAAYVSPLLVKEGNKKLIISVLYRNLIVVDADNGKILCKHDYSATDSEKSFEVWSGSPFINTNTPVYKDRHIYITSGYNHVGAMFKLSDDYKSLKKVWTDSVLDVHHGGVVLVDNYLYGSNWTNNRNGNWCCIDWKTGEKKYETKWETKGSIIYNDGMLYCYDERKGNIALVKATPKEFKIISSFTVPKGKGPHWSHLVIKNGVLYVRHEDALMAYDIKKK